MNTKFVLILTLSIFFSCGVFAQKDDGHKTHHVDLTNTGRNGRVKIGTVNARLMVEGYAGNRIEIEAFGVTPIPERAKGLRPLGVSGVDNTGIGLAIKEVDDVVEITQTRRGADRYIMRIPQSMALNIDYETHFGSQIDVKNINQEIEINSMNSSMRLTDITGPAVLHSVGGLIEVVFNRVEQESPISITSTGGEIDVALPASTKASFELRTMGGNIYTDLNLKTGKEEGNLQKLGGQSFEGTLNGGGVTFSINSVGGTIYLRDKSKKSE